MAVTSKENHSLQNSKNKKCFYSKNKTMVKTDNRFCKKKKTSEEKENKKITQYCPSEYKQQYLKTHTPRIDNCPPRYLSYR